MNAAARRERLTATRAGILALATLVTTLSLAARPRTFIDATLRDLATRPLDFANRHVRVTGTIRVGFEVSVLTDDWCDAAGCERIWLDYPEEDERLAFARGWPVKRFLAAWQAGELAGDGPAVEWQAPASLSALDPKQREALHEALEREGEEGARVVVTGRYDYAGDGLLVRSSPGHFSQQSAYGHLNCCRGRLVLESVEVRPTR